MEIDRLLQRQRVLRALARSDIVAVLGPRQSGKTTLARHVTRDHAEHTWFDLENPRDLARLDEPMLALSKLSGLVILDEVQRLPKLFPLLRVLADRADAPAKFLLLGSAAPTLLQQASESLAGRVAFIDLAGFDIREVPSADLLWQRGGFPRSYLAVDNEGSFAWREDFLRTFVQTDLQYLAPRMSPLNVRRLWSMLAHYHGQTWNGAELGRSLGVSQHTVRHYLDLLTQTFMVRQLEPWFANVKKRLVRSPKIYIRDSGLLHALLGVETQGQLEGHPKVGASWEGFALEQVLRIIPGDPYFYSTHGGSEVDLVLQRRVKRWAFEFKRADAPKVTRSMREGAGDLQLDHLWVVYPGHVRYQMADNTTALPLADLPSLVSQPPA